MGKLVLTRRTDEMIVIGEGHEAIVMKVIGVRGDKVRLGFTADRSIPINRREVHIEKLKSKYIGNESEA